MMCEKNETLINLCSVLSHVIAQVSRTVAREAGEGLPTAAADPDPLSKHLASV